MPLGALTDEGKEAGVWIFDEKTSTVTFRPVQIDQLGIGPQSRLLQFASLSFDAMVWEISAGLASGAALVLSGAERSGSGPKWPAPLGAPRND